MVFEDNSLIILFLIRNKNCHASLEKYQQDDSNEGLQYMCLYRNKIVLEFYQHKNSEYWDVEVW